jgi:multisubunit Na+/H+ antiporter MnhG subunit
MPPEVEKNLKNSYLRTLKFFDKLEDRIRHRLSHYPLTYALIAGVAIVMFWRGVWQVTDSLPMLHYPFISLILSIITMLLTGTFVSFFIGDQILLSGLKHEKRVAEKTEKDVAQEETELAKMLGRLHFIEKDIVEIKELLEKLSTQNVQKKGVKKETLKHIDKENSPL